MITKKRLMVIFTIILSLILVSKVLSAEIITFKPSYGYTKAKVNLRYQSLINSNNILQSVPKNTKLKIIGEQNDFYAVQLENNKIGFISKDYIVPQNQKTEGYVFSSLIPEEYELTDNANVRIGPSKNFKKIKSLKKGTIVTVFGRIENFYTVIFDNNKIGMISVDLLEKSYENIDENPNNLSKSDLVIYYINEARKENGLKKLTDSADLNRLATLKAEDMVKNSYFLHTSPTYGSPFEMLKNYGITYEYAGENLAGNVSMKNATTKWLESDEHKKNILSDKYTKIGVGVQKSDKYGYIIVAIFTD